MTASFPKIVPLIYFRKAAHLTKKKTKATLNSWRFLRTRIKVCGNLVSNQSNLVLLYADDTVIIRENKHSFQTCLDDFYKYCQTWKSTINFSKTKVVVFGTNKPSLYNFNINGQIIKTVKEYKYLGVIFSNSGSFLSYRKHIITQVNKAMHLLYMRINNLDLPLELQIKLFDHTVLPILINGSDMGL